MHDDRNDEKPSATDPQDPLLTASISLPAGVILLTLSELHELKELRSVLDIALLFLLHHANNKPLPKWLLRELLDRARAFDDGFGGMKQ